MRLYNGRWTYGLHKIYSINATTLLTNTNISPHIPLLHWMKGGVALWGGVGKNQNALNVRDVKTGKDQQNVLIITSWYWAKYLDHITVLLADTLYSTSTICPHPSLWFPSPILHGRAQVHPATSSWVGLSSQRYTFCVLVLRAEKQSTSSQRATLWACSPAIFNTRHQRSITQALA